MPCRFVIPSGKSASARGATISPIKKAIGALAHPGRVPPRGGRQDLTIYLFHGWPHPGRVPPRGGRLSSTNCLNLKPLFSLFCEPLIFQPLTYPIAKKSLLTSFFSRCYAWCEPYWQYMCFKTHPCQGKTMNCPSVSFRFAHDFSNNQRPLLIKCFLGSYMFYTVLPGGAKKVKP
jgi:hypothetical protein